MSNHILCVNFCSINLVSYSLHIYKAVDNEQRGGTGICIIHLCIWMRRFSAVRWVRVHGLKVALELSAKYFTKRVCTPTVIKLTVMVCSSQRVRINIPFRKTLFRPFTWFYLCISPGVVDNVANVSVSQNHSVETRLKGTKFKTLRAI